MATLHDSLRAGGLIQGPLQIRPRTVGEVPFDVQGIAGQTAVLARVRNSAGTTVFSVDNSGNLVIGGSTTISIDEALVGNASITGTLSVTGTTSLTGAVTMASTLSVTGNVVTTGSFQATNNLTLGGISSVAASHLRLRTAAPSNIGSNGILYALAGDANTTELWYRDAVGNDVQITDAGALEGASLFWDDDEYIRMGNTAASPDVRLGWNTTQTVDAWYFGTADAQNVFLVAENGDRAFDFAHGAQTNPTVFIHSAAQNTTQWLSFVHNQTDALINIGAGDLLLSIAGGNLAPSANDGVALGISGTAFADLFLADGAVINFNAGDVTITHSVNALSIGGATAITILQAVATTGAPQLLLVSGGAHTTLTAGSQLTDVDFNLARTVQFATGAITTLTGVQVSTPTYGFVGASTVTNALGLAINNPPIIGTNATFANTVGLFVGNTNATFGTSMYGAVIYMPQIANGYGANTGVTGLLVGSGTVAMGNQTATTAESYVISAGAVTYTSSVLTRTITDVATLNVDGPPVAGANVVFTNAALSLRVGSGVSAFGGAVVPLTSNGSALGSATIMWADLFLASGAVINFDNGDVTLTHAVNGLTLGGGNFTLNQPVFDAATPTALTVTGGAHTAITAATECIGANLNFSATKTWAAGAGPLALQREVIIQSPAYVGNVAGALTMTEAATLYITGAPTAGANMTITRPYAFLTGAGVSGFGGNAVPKDNDGAALGTTALMWSDLFLASASVINFNNGDVTITHGANVLEVNGGFFGIGGTPSVALHVLGASGVEFRIGNTGDASRGFNVTVTGAAGVGNALVSTTSGGYTLQFGIDSVSELTLTTAALSPTITDGNALGTTLLMWADLFLASGGVINFDNGDVTITHAANALTLAGGDYTLTQAVATSGSPTGLTFTGGAHTTIATLTEASDVIFALNRTVQWATGNISTQRAFRIAAPTYGFVGASTVTDAATLAITGAPVQGTNATLSNTHALLIQAGAVSTATASYGLTVNAQTGATTNYSAAFLGGRVGIGTAVPVGTLTIGTPPSSSFTNAAGIDISSAFNANVHIGQIAIFSTDAVAIDVGGKIVFGGTYTGTSDTPWAGISGFKENATDNNYAGYLSLWTRANGSNMAERLRIDSAGSVLIGITAAAISGTPLTVYGNRYDTIRVGRSDAASFAIGIPNGSVIDSLEFYGFQAGYDGYTFTGVSGEKMRITTVGNVGIGATTFGTNATRTFSILSGTAPTTGPIDTVQFYSSDDAAGHTIPSFFCEGTNVIATGQGDSASSVRVKVRINGTVVTLLGI